jgi:serine phosphatase RsbU (regulator of sigma subunit)
MGQRLEQEERERIDQELQVAWRIQEASLPEEVPALEGWQIAPFYRPAREVGGDFYDFHFLSEGRVGLVVGDATGKGVPAALVMSTTLGMLRLAAQSYSSPGLILQRVNEALFVNIPANCSSPASTPSSIPRVGYCATPTPVMTCLIYIMMMATLKN